MIVKIIKGKGFRGLANYVLRAWRGEIVAGVMAGRTPRELAAEFGQLRRLNPKLGRAVAHFSLSASPNDPPLSADQWQAIAERFMADMGWGAESGAPWCAVVHRDTDHQHLHIMACRIDQLGKTIADANDFRRAEAAIRRIEQDFGLVAVASPARKKPARAPPAPDTANNTSHQEEPIMTNPAEQHHPFDPASPQAATWPEPFEPGRDLAEIATIELPGITAPSARVPEPLTDRQRRSLRRCVAEDDYAEAALSIFGPELAHVFKHGRGAVLYFARPEAGRLADQGDKITALAGMSEAAAARRIVALACGPGRKWKSITFTGSATFVELAMREALARSMTVHAEGAEQAAILARLIAETRGGMGANAGPAAGAAVVDPVLAPLAELDKLAEAPQPSTPKSPPETSPKTPSESAPVASPPAPPAAPRIGVAPMFMNLRERLEARRAQQTQGPASAPTSPSKPPSRPSTPGKA